MPHFSYLWFVNAAPDTANALLCSAHAPQAVVRFLFEFPFSNDEVVIEDLFRLFMLHYISLIHKIHVKIINVSLNWTFLFLLVKLWCGGEFREWKWDGKHNSRLNINKTRTMQFSYNVLLTVSCWGKFYSTIPPSDIAFNNNFNLVHLHQGQVTIRIIIITLKI